MINGYEKAKSLRLRGYSYNEIQRMLGIPKSTQSGWFKNVVLSREAQKRILSRVSQGVINGLVKRNKMQTIIAQKRVKKIHREARVEVPKLNNKDLFIIGTALYWAEGYKRVVRVHGREVTHHAISFTNSDPSMVKVFISFLNEILKINSHKIRLSLRLFRHINEQKAVGYWSRVTGLSRGSFEKASYVISRASLGKRPFNRLPYGTIQVRVLDTNKFHRLMGWIEGLQERLAHLS